MNSSTCINFVKRKYGEDYESSSLRGLFSSVSRFLKEAKRRQISRKHFGRHRLKANNAKEVNQTQLNRLLIGKGRHSVRKILLFSQRFKETKKCLYFTVQKYYTLTTVTLNEKANKFYENIEGENLSEYKISKFQHGKCFVQFTLWSFLYQKNRS